MAITHKSGAFQLVIKRNGKQIWVRTPAQTKAEAKKIEQECLAALKSTDYSDLSSAAREVLLKMHINRGWEFPAGLRLDVSTEPRDFVLWNEDGYGAIQLLTSDPIVREKKKSTRDRYDMCFKHLVRLLKKNRQMKDLWTNDIRDYYAKRKAEGASPSTVGWEISTLSAIFGVLIDNKKITGITENPCNHVRGKGRGLKFASRKRQAYWSYDLVNAITTVWGIHTKRPLCPEWLVPIILTSYYTGMRLTEVLKIQPHQIHLHKRMMYLTPADQPIKEGESKRIPIHRDLEPVLEESLKVRASGIDNVFLLSDRQGTRPVTKDTVELAMRRIVKVLNPYPRFSFHDLRHTFKANSRRSGIPEVISERIIGHADAHGYLDGNLPVSQRYGQISDNEFIEAIDNLTVHHGDSDIDGTPVSLFGLRQNRQLLTP